MFSIGVLKLEVYGKFCITILIIFPENFSQVILSLASPTLDVRKKFKVALSCIETWIKDPCDTPPLDNSTSKNQSKGRAKDPTEAEDIYYKG